MCFQLGVALNITEQKLLEQQLFEEKELDVDLLMIVAALGAAGLGLWRREWKCN